jgi:hypothetical protein
MESALILGIILPYCRRCAAEKQAFGYWLLAFGNFSTSKLLNFSTSQLLNFSTSQLLNFSTSKLLNFSPLTSPS